jgi:DNA-binding GntR family transcriptional regulator
MSRHLLRDNAYQLLKEKIVTLAYKPGSQLMEQDLCAEIGIGRTPVREALQRLSSEKLIKIIPRKGIFVSDINMWELSRLMEARIMLESFCIRKIVGRVTGDQIEKLRFLFRHTASLADERKIHELLDIDRQFHMGLVGLVDNFFIEEMAAKIYDQLVRTWYLSFSRRSREELMETVDEHLAIVDALDTGHRETAERAMMQHLENYQAKVMSIPPFNGNQ